MTVAALVAALYSSGITYWATSDSTLGYRGPAGAMTLELRREVKAHKADLLALCSNGVTISGRRREPPEWREVV